MKGYFMIQKESYSCKAKQKKKADFFSWIIYPRKYDEENGKKKENGKKLTATLYK